MKLVATLYGLADALEAAATWLKKQAAAARQREIARKPLSDRLVFAAYSRCPCGHGMAYDPAGESGKPYGGYWDCSAILLGIADDAVKHEARLPFAFWEVKSERQPSAGGATTRTSIARELVVAKQ